MNTNSIDSNQSITSQNLSATMENILTLSDKAFKIINNSNLIYAQNEYCVIASTEAQIYLEFSYYFQNLMSCISEFLDNFTLQLDTSEGYSLLSLTLSDDQLELAENIKNSLLETFPDDIEQIGIVKNRINILDLFYEFDIKI